MSKMAVIGHNRANMVDCSDVIPVPPPLVGKPHLPAGKKMADIEQAVSPMQPTCVYRCADFKRSATRLLSPLSPRTVVSISVSEI
jgi:hypothetical protein